MNPLSGITNSVCRRRHQNISGSGSRTIICSLSGVRTDSAGALLPHAEAPVTNLVHTVHRQWLHDVSRRITGESSKIAVSKWCSVTNVAKDHTFAVTGDRQHQGANMRIILLWTVKFITTKQSSVGAPQRQDCRWLSNIDRPVSGWLRRCWGPSHTSYSHSYCKNH